MTRPPLRIGLVGYGKIAREAHEPAIRRSPAMVLVGVCHSGPGSAPVDAPVFDDLPAMLSAVDLDAVAVCTPPRPRRRLALQALDHGLNVLLEKPAAATLCEMRDLQERARAAGRTVVAAYHSRFNPAVAEARALLAGSTLRSLRVEWREDVRRWHPGQPWVFAPGGFGVFDPGFNALSILSEILPEPIFVEEAEFGVPAGLHAPIWAELRFSASSVEADLRASFDWRATPRDVWSIAVETQGGISLRLEGGGARLLVDGGERFLKPAHEYDGVYEHFSEMCLSSLRDMDDRPLALAADAFTLAVCRVEPTFTF